MLEGFIEEEDIIALKPDILVSKIRPYISDIDLDPDMSSRYDEHGIPCLRPNEERDMIVLDYALIKAVLDKESGKRRTTALAYIAILICHEMAHVLEFRFIRKGSRRDDGKAFETPPGITCAQVGTSWERITFGGSISPVSPGSDLMSIIGLSIQSSWWRYLHMSITYSWINGLFDETFWVGQASFRLSVLYNPELALTSTIQFDDDEESLAEPCTPTKHRRGCDVQVGLYTIPTIPAQPSQVYKKALCARRTCGSKKIYLSGPSLWPFNGVARIAPAPGHSSLTERYQTLRYQNQTPMA